MVAKVKPANHKIVVVCPGGGLKGVIQTGILAGAEKWLGCPLGDVVDLVVASSVGAVTATAIGLDIPMRTAQRTIAEHKAEYFTQNYFRRALNLVRYCGLYNYRAVLARLRDVGADVTLGDLKTRTVITAACRNDGKTHYFKSTDPKDASRRLLDVISYAFAAPWYFGARNSPSEDRTYFDAGVGTQNNPVITAFYEVVKLLKWHEQGTVSVLVVGTGYTDSATPYTVTSKEKLVGQLAASIRFASSQSDTVNSTVALFIDSLLASVDFNIVDVRIPDGSNAMDKVDYVDTYIDIATKTVAELDYSKLLGIPG